MTKVIWIDDDYEKQDALFDSAISRHGMELIPFKTSKSGMEELSNNLYAYQGVILDAKVYDKSEDEVAKLIGLQNSIYRLKELSSKRFIPYVVFTGQKDLASNDTFEDMLPGVAVFKKGIETDAMFEHLKNEINLLDETRLKKEYKQAFDASDFIGEEYSVTLLQILLSIRKPLEKFDDNLYFTQIRLILEAMFRKSNKYGLLHDNCIDAQGKVNLTESSRFLAGKELKYSDFMCSESHFPRLISDLVQMILFTTGAASHTSDPMLKDNINIAEYRKSISTPYLLYSLTFQLMDVLVWFKNHIHQNDDVVLNKSKYIMINKGTLQGIYTSTLEMDEKGNYHCDEVILTYKMVKENNYKVGDEIKIIKIVNNTNEKTMDLYLKSALQTEKL